MKIKFYLLCFLVFGSFEATYAQIADTDSAYLHYVDNIKITANNFDKLLPAITQPGNTMEQKLKLVYYWVFDHINFDTERFVTSGPLIPLATEETLKSGKALCYEYNGLLSAACAYLKIPGFDIEGYVKFYGFEPGNTFTQNNHIWHAVYLSGKWKMIDLLWASGTLSIKGNNYKFDKSLQTSYFLADPKDFLKTHLPADPIWQFEDYPLTIDGFTDKEYGINIEKRGSYINCADSIKAFYKLSAADKEIRSGLRAYKFNPNNPDQLIVIYYNIAANLMNKANATKSELISARTYFSQSIQYIAKTTNKDLKALQPVCERGITAANSRLKKNKT